MFLQLPHADGDRVAYLVACETSREAVLVDPEDGEEPRYRELLAELDLRLVYTLETTASRPRSVASHAYSRLLTELGASPVEPPPSASTRDRFGVPGVRPVNRWRDEAAASDRIELVDAAGYIVELAAGEPYAPGGDVCRIGGARPSTFRLRYDRLAIVVGALEIEAVATGLGEGGLAYLVNDRVITGTSLAAVDGVAGVPRALLSLPPDTLLFASRAADGPLVSSVRQEQLLAARRRSRRVVPDGRS